MPKINKKDLEMASLEGENALMVVIITFLILFVLILLIINNNKWEKEIEYKTIIEKEYITVWECKIKEITNNSYSSYSILVCNYKDKECFTWIDKENFTCINKDKND